MAEDIFRRLSKLIDSATKNMIKTQTGASRGVGEVMLDDSIAQAIYGSGDDFLKSQENFEKIYYQMLSDPENLRPGMANAVDVQQMQKLGKIDLSYFHFEARQKLQNIYRQRVIKLPELIANVGFPNIALPEGANEVRLATMFEVDQKMTHPAFSVLNKMLFNVDPLSETIEDMSFNTQNIMSSSQIKRNMSQIAAVSSGSLFDPASRIATLDIESTGLMFGSQARSVSVIQRNGLDAAAQQVAGLSFMYDSPRLAGILAADKKGNLSQTLSEFIQEAEGFKGSSLIGSEDEFFQKMTGLFGYLSDESQVDYLTGHNIGYDITTLMDTMKGMRGYQQNKELNLVVNKFLDRVNNNPNFMIDTLEVGRQYMRSMAQNEIANLGDMSSIQRGQEYIARFFSQEALADISLGGKATYAAMENFIQNTNLLDLIAQEQHAPEIFGKIFRGSHIAETDTIMQDYMLKYIHQGKLEFRRPNSTAQGARVTQEAIDLARRSALKSSAIVPEANISDPTQLSSAAMRYVQSNEGLVRARVSITAQQASSAFGIDLGPDVEGGYIKYAKGSFGLYTGVGDPIELDTASARTYLRDVISKAKDDSYKTTINITPSGSGEPPVTTSFNPFERQIVSLGVTRRQNSAMEIAQMLTDLSPMYAGQIDVDQYVGNVGNLYENFGDNPRVIGGQSTGRLRSVLHQIGSAMNPRKTFSMDFNMAGRSASEILGQYVSHGQTMAGVGMPNYMLNPSELAFGDLLSRATFSVANERMGNLDAQTTQLPPSVSSSIRQSMRYATKQEVGDVVSQLGVSHFRYQESLRLMESTNQASLGKKLILPYEYFKSIELTSDPAISNMGEAISQGRVNMSLSFLERMGKDSEGEEVVHNILNLVWKEGRDDSGLTSQRIAEKLYEDFIESDNFKKIITEPGSDLLVEVQNMRETFSGLTKEQAIGELEEVAKRGIVTGYVQDTGRAGAIGAFVENAKKMGVDLSRDTANTVLGSVVDDDTGVIRAVFFDEVNARGVHGNNFTRRMAAMAKASVSASNSIADRINADAELLTTAIQNIKTGARKQEMSKAVDIYNNIKPRAGLAALGAAAMAGGYYLTRKKEERDLYNETIEQQPYESSIQNDVINSYTSSISSNPSSRRDPLVTAGVVGNLDRNKIGHTKMGNNKYDHLFGG